MSRQDDDEDDRVRGENVADGNIILSEVRKTHQILLDLTTRLKKTEKRVKTIEEKMNSRADSSISVTPKSSRNKDIPQEVRVSLFYDVHLESYT